jgi:Tol biopolymer transport system component
VRGEIGVMAAAGAAAPALASEPGRGARHTPRSAYNPAVSADGRFVAFEAAEGNLNFAKRYGQMQVFVRDLAGGRTRLASRSALDLGASSRRHVPRSAYNPSISGDGRLVAYESSESRQGRLDVFVRDLRASRARRLRPPAGAGRLSEPALTADGRSLAYTALEGERSAVWSTRLAGGAPVRVSPAGAEAYEPSVSRSGRYVAYTRLLAGRRSRVEVHDLRTGATRVAAPAAGAGLPEGASASEPSLSADGRRVAFTLRPLGMRETSVLVADVATGATELVSRRSGALGPAAAGSSGRPSMSGDGRSVAFTSDAYNLAPEKCNGARGVFVRDLEARTTRLASRNDGANRYAGPTKGSSTGADLVLAMRCGRV